MSGNLCGLSSLVLVDLELSLEDCYEAYRQRYDLEHLFRFGKQKLLMTSYLTPDVKHEENWSLVPWISNPGLASDRLPRFKLTMIAYVNLWAARNLAVVLPREWEQYLKTNESAHIYSQLSSTRFLSNNLADWDNY